LNFSWSAHSLHRTFIAFLVTVVAAAISWHLFENPINSMKQNFSYRVIPDETGFSGKSLYYRISCWRRRVTALRSNTR
jgi:peptidoglycan/LPS O-acetylase OafA/YrhL